MAASSMNHLSEIMLDKEKQKKDREKRLKGIEQQLRGGFRNVSDYIVEEEHQRIAKEQPQKEQPQKEAVPLPDDDEDEYSEEILPNIDDEPATDDDEPSTEARTPDGFTYDYLPKFINNFQVWGGVGYFNYRIKPKQFSPRREELRALRKAKKATPEELEELDALNELLEKIDDAKQEIVEAGRMTKAEQKELSKALQKYLEVKKMNISPEMTLAIGFSAPMLRMAVAIESKKAELGI